MLRHVSSRELAQWQAYERYEGPVGPVYERAALRAIAIYSQQSEKAKFPDPVEFMRPPSSGETFGDQAAFDRELLEG